MTAIAALLLVSFTAPARAVAPGDFDALLKERVVAGQVDYRGLKSDPRLPAYLATLVSAKPGTLPSAEARLAFWINAYNAYTLQLIVAHYPLKSIRDVPHPDVKSPWDLPVANIGGHSYTLNQIEHDILRAQLKEPRIHYALVCAAKSCPPLRAEAYESERIQAQLDDQARLFLATQNHFDPIASKAELSSILKWYGSDFGATPAEVLTALAPYTPEPVRAALIKAPAKWAIRYLDYDWSLNERRH